MDPIPYRSSGVRDDLSRGQSRLFTFGILLVIFGSFCALATLTLLLPAYSSSLAQSGVSPFAPPPPPSRGMVSSRAPSFATTSAWWLPPFLLLGALSTLFIWTGIASIKMRRWTRPIVISFAGMFIFSTIVAFLQFLTAGLADKYIGAPPPPPAFGRPAPAASPGFIQDIIICILVLLGIGVPLLFLLGYRSRPIVLALDENDPNIAWTDRAPVPVFALAVALAWTGLISLLGFVPSPMSYFLDSQSAIVDWIFWIALALFLAVGARAVYYRHPIGPWIAMVLVVVIAACMMLAATALVDKQIELQNSYNRWSDPIPTDSQSIPISALLASLAYVLPALGYILYARRRMGSSHDQSVSVTPIPLPPITARKV